MTENLALLNGFPGVTLDSDGDFPPATLLAVGGLVREEMLIEVSAGTALP